MAPEIVAPTYRKRGISVFDTSRPGWIVEAYQATSPVGDILQGSPETLRNYDILLAIASNGNVSDLARARQVMDNIDPYKKLAPDDFEKFDHLSF